MKRWTFFRDTVYISAAAHTAQVRLLLLLLLLSIAVDSVLTTATQLRQWVVGLIRNVGPASAQ